ncbi:MAG: DUF2785 domain-containing protein [Bdellovibrionales bacterium]|nr:DUF2785 domain-containing protein [Bdellovibrionales bacterium]
MQMKRLKLTAAILGWTLSSMAFAQQDRSPVIANKHFINNAVQVQITPRGLKYFETQLSTILGNLGYNFSEGYFPAQKIVSEKPIDMNELGKKNPEALKTYLMVKDMLTKWLVGFSLTDHRPVVEIGESGYSAAFTRFALITDEALMNQLGKRDGAVLAIDLEVKRLTVATQAVRVWDMNNLSFVKVGMDDVSITAGDDKTPLKVRLPFYIRMNAQGNIDFESLEIQENLADIPLTVKYKKLIVPQVAVEVDGHKYVMNTDQLRQTIDEQLPTILVEVRKYLSDFAKKQLPDMLNQKVKENLSGALEQVQDMVAPGQEPNDTRPAFKWGLKLTDFRLKQSLGISLAAYAEDPVNPNVNLAPGMGSRGVPTLNHLPVANYDIAMTLDRGLINRILQLSFLRKNFEKIPQSDGTSLKLTEAPLLDYITPPAATTDKETYLKLKVSVEVEPHKPLWLDDKVILSFDLVCKLRRSQKGDEGMEIAQQYIDTNSVVMDKKYLTIAGKIAEGLGGQVTKGIKEELKTRSKDWVKNNETIPGSLDLPPAFLGMKLDIQKVTMDPNGHLLMYLNYKNALGVK